MEGTECRGHCYFVRAQTGYYFLGAQRGHYYISGGTKEVYSFEDTKGGYNYDGHKVVSLLCGCMMEGTITVEHKEGVIVLCWAQWKNFCYFVGALLLCGAQKGVLVLFQ